MEKTKEVKKGNTFSLPNEKITVKFIPRKKGMAANVDSNHVISGGMLSKAIKTYQCPLMSRGGGLANILTKDEKNYLEAELQINLSVYGDFWTNYKVKLHKDDASNVFDLSEPMHYLALKILENYPDEIAHSWDQRKDKPSYMFVITRPGEVTSERKMKLDTKKLAFKLFGKIEDNKNTLIGVLKLLTNQPISENSDIEWLQGQVQEYVDNNPTNFVNLVKDPSFETKLLINRAVTAGVIKKNGNKYGTVDGLELCNSKEQPTFNNAVRFLEDDKNQEVRLLIEARLDNTD